jgi:hypothetical protein
MLTMDLETKNHFNLDELINDKIKKQKKKFGKKQDEGSDKKDDFKVIFRKNRLN